MLVWVTPKAPDMRAPTPYSLYAACVTPEPYLHPWTEVCPRPGKRHFFYSFFLIFAAFERSRSPSEELCRLFFIGTPWCSGGDPQVDQKQKMVH